MLGVDRACDGTADDDLVALFQSLISLEMMIACAVGAIGKALLSGLDISDVYPNTGLLAQRLVPG